MTTPRYQPSILHARITLEKEGAGQPDVGGQRRKEPTQRVRVRCKENRSCPGVSILFQYAHKDDQLRW